MISLIYLNTNLYNLKFNRLFKFIMRILKVHIIATMQHRGEVPSKRKSSHIRFILLSCSFFSVTTTKCGYLSKKRTQNTPENLHFSENPFYLVY